MYSTDHYLASSCGFLLENLISLVTQLADKGPTLYENRSFTIVPKRTRSLSEFNPVHIYTHFFKIHFNIIPHLRRDLVKYWLSDCPIKVVHAFPIYSLHVTYDPYSILLDRVSVKELLTAQFSPASVSSCRLDQNRSKSVLSTCSQTSPMAREASHRCNGSINSLGGET
jgi:hypothetical protein